MNIRHLKIFIEVAQSGKMSAAAAKFYISQPSVSQVIRDLENHYHTKLFERISQRLYITPSGLVLLERAQDIVSRFDALEDEMLHLSKSIPFRMGVTPYIDHSVFAEVMDSLNFRCPDIDFSAVSASDNIIEQKLLNFQIDAGIMSGLPRNNDLAGIPLIQDYLVLICPEGNDLYPNKELTVRQLDGHFFALHEEGSYQRQMFDAMIHDYPVNIRKCWEASDVTILKKSVLNHHCLTLSSALAFREEILSGKVHAYLIDDARRELTIHLVYPKQKGVTSYLKTLVYIFEHLEIPELPPKEYFLDFK